MAKCPKFEHLTREQVEEFYAQALRRLEVASLEAHINLVLGADRRDYEADLRSNEALMKQLREDRARVLALNFGED